MRMKNETPKPIHMNHSGVPRTTVAKNPHVNTVNAIIH
jgi:hypothetical protein